MKKIILIIFLFFIYNCGYTSVYKNIEKKDFEIIIVKMKGDRVMNNLIQNEYSSSQLYIPINSIKNSILSYKL